MVLFCIIIINLEVVCLSLIDCWFAWLIGLLLSVSVVLFCLIDVGLCMTLCGRLLALLDLVYGYLT